MHEALRAGNPPDELQPWLYRLTRNRAINMVRRARRGEESLDSELEAARACIGRAAGIFQRLLGPDRPHTKQARAILESLSG